MIKGIGIDIIDIKRIKSVIARYGDTFNTMHPGSDYDINSIDELINIVKKENDI